MSPTENPEGLLATSRALVRKVEDLDAHLRVAQVQARRMKTLTVITFMFTLVSIVGVLVMVSLYQQVHEATAVNQRNAVTSCENGNEQRRANLTLWVTVLNLSAASNPNQTPAQRERAEEFGKWVRLLYAPRDCSDLSKKVDIPPPPQITPTS